MSVIRQIQREQDEWQNANFGPDGDPVDPLLGIAEETGELCHAHLKGRQGIRMTPEEVRAAKVDAVADIMIYIIGYCNREKIDLHEALTSTWARVSGRDWVADPIGAADE